MKHEVLIGQTDYTVLVKIRDDAGAPATGLTEASIDIAYARVETDNDVTTTDVTPAALAALTTAHTDWGFEEVSATDHPGLYRLDIADAVFASGAWSAVVTVTGTGLDPADLEFILVPCAPLDGVSVGRWLGTAAATPTVAGVPEVDVTHLLGTAWLAPGTAGTPDVNVKLWNALTTVALPLIPTTAGRTLDVSAGGEAGVDWANVGNQGTVVSLTQTLIKSVSDVEALIGTPSDLGGGATLAFNLSDIEAQTDDIGVAGAGLTAADNAIIAVLGTPAGASMSADIAAVKVDTAAILVDTGTTLDGRIPAALVGGRMDSSVGAMAANVITAAATAADFSTEVNTAPLAILGTPAGASMSADIAAVKTQTAAIEVDTAEIGAAGAGLTNINLPNQTMDIVGNITGNLSGSVGSVTGAVGSVTGAVGSVGAGGITAASIATGAVDADALATDAVTEITDAILALVIETGLTFKNFCRLAAAAAAGKLSGAETTTIVVRNAVADDKDRITATVDADGNRSAIVLDLT